jgi:hypothetical protein
MSGWRLFATSLLVVLGSVAFADVPCTCLTPPGGSCSCEDGQYAICKIRDGRCVAVCRNSAQGDNRAVVAGLVSAMFDTTPAALGYDANDRIFVSRFAPSPVPGLLRQLTQTLSGSPPGTDGYILKFTQQERQSWSALTRSDPGPEMRVGIAPQLLPRVREGLSELVPLVAK